LPAFFRIEIAVVVAVPLAVAAVIEAPVVAVVEKPEVPVVAVAAVVPPPLDSDKAEAGPDVEPVPEPPIPE
jgi:hypothetical protein